MFMIELNEAITQLMQPPYNGYAGDPLVHPDLDRMCRIAHDAGVNSHINTNFSFPLSDARIDSIVASGLTRGTPQRVNVPSTARSASCRRPRV